MIFNIIENATPDYEEKFDEFIKLYNSGLYKVPEIIEELEWTQGIYNRAYKKAKNEKLLKKTNLAYTTIEDKPLKNKLPKNYTKQGKWFVVARIINKQRVYFGKYQHELEARLAVSYFNENGWNKARAAEVKRQVKKDIHLIKTWEA